MRKGPNQSWSSVARILVLAVVVALAGKLAPSFAFERFCEELLTPQTEVRDGGKVHELISHFQRIFSDGPIAPRVNDFAETARILDLRQIDAAEIEIMSPLVRNVYLGRWKGRVVVIKYHDQYGAALYEAGFQRVLNEEGLCPRLFGIFQQAGVQDELRNGRPNLKTAEVMEYIPDSVIVQAPLANHLREFAPELRPKIFAQMRLIGRTLVRLKISDGDLQFLVNKLTGKVTLADPALFSLPADYSPSDARRTLERINRMDPSAP